jgi:hypothetical protein
MINKNNSIYLFERKIFFNFKINYNYNEPKAIFFVHHISSSLSLRFFFLLFLSLSADLLRQIQMNHAEFECERSGVQMRS